MEYTRQETMAWHDRLHAYHQQRDREMQHAFQEMAAGRCPQWPSAEGPPAQPVLLTFEEFVAQNAGPSPVSSSPIYSPKACHAFQHSHISRAYVFSTSREQVHLPLAVVFAALRRHGARPLRSTEAEAEEEAVLAVALPLAVTTWASAVLAVTTSAVLDVLALKPLGHIVAVLVVMILICL